MCLREFLRSSLGLGDREDILREELALAQPSDVATARFGDRLIVAKFRRLPECRIPALILQPLVENAVATRRLPVEGGVICMAVSRNGNDVPSPSKRLDRTPSWTGVGLAHVRRRFKSATAPKPPPCRAADGLYRVDLRFPCVTVPELPPDIVSVTNADGVPSPDPLLVQPVSWLTGSRVSLKIAMRLPSVRLDPCHPPDSRLPSMNAQEHRRVEHRSAPDRPLPRSCLAVAPRSRLRLRSRVAERDHVHTSCPSPRSCGRSPEAASAATAGEFRASHRALRAQRACQPPALNGFNR